MDQLRRLSPTAQIVLGATVLYVIVSFLDWQQVSLLGTTLGQTEWHGIGVVAGLLGVALLAWEVARTRDARIDLGSVAPGLVSVVLALALLVFTFITFVSHDVARHWPAWVGLLLSIAIAVAGVVRAREEGIPVGWNAGAAETREAETPPESPPAETGNR
jgi:drug/metabolite transporter (DMT)-like permease